MAKCGCAGDTCSCLIVAGRNVRVEGTGTQTNPYVISADQPWMAVTDTATINLTLTGSGIPSDPFVIKGDFIGSLLPPDFQGAESRNWAGAVSLADVTKPTTIRATLTGDVTSVALPSWSSASSGSITLILYQDATGGRTWVQPGTSSSGEDFVLTPTPGARDVVVLLWTGIQWVVIPSAVDVK